MAIEHVQFQGCDACGTRFRDHGHGRVGPRMLCDACQAKLGRLPGSEPVTVGAEGDLAADIERTLAQLESLGMPDSSALPQHDDPGVVEPSLGDEGTGVSVAEIAARLGVTPRPRRRRRRRRHDWERNERHNRNARPPRRRRGKLRRLRWPIYVALALALVAGTAVATWKLRARGRYFKALPVPEVLASGSATLPVPDLPPYEVARELAVRFVSEEDPDEMLPMIRQWPGCRQDVAAFLAKNPPVEGAAEMLRDMPPVIRPDVAYQSFGLLLPSGTGRLVQIIGSEGGPKVDFKAFIEWCSVPHEALLGGEIDHADEVRAILRPSTYFNYEFSDSDRFLALSATLEGESEQLTVYLARDSAGAEQLTHAINRDGMHPAVFSLQAVGESHKRRQFLLSRLLAVGFVVPEE